MKANLLIATPTAGGVVTTAFYRSMMPIAVWCDRQKIKFSVRTIDSSDIAFNRNAAASLVASDGQFTHLFFVDSDMEIASTALARSLEANKPIVACLCPKRSTKNGKTETNAVNPKGNGPLVTVDYAGTGVMLIQRKTLLELLTTNQIRGESDPRYKYPIHGFFDNIILNATRLGEDHSFCHRWRHLCGGEIWMIMDEPIGHIGSFTFRST